MSRVHPLGTIGEAIASVIRDARASYTPAQKVIEFDEFWQYPATKTKIDARLPGAFVQLDQGSLALVLAGAQEGTVRFRVNHVFTLADTGNYPTQGTGAIQKTLELFSANEDFDLSIDASGFEVQGCVPVEFGLVDELMDFGLGWATVTLEVTYTSSNT